MNLDQITPLILTGNEAPNIERCLAKLAWAKRIVVIDSFSTDGTLEILKNYPAVEVFQRPFDHFADQCNFGLRKITTEWVLSLDADYVLSDALIEELRTLPEDPAVAGYRARFKYCIDGRPLRSTLLPPRNVLYRRSLAAYREDGHAHRVFVDGDVKPLEGTLDHDDRKPFSRWYASQKRYAAAEVKKLRETPFRDLGFNDKVRSLIVFAPPLVVLYCLLVKGLALDWPRGWFYVLQRWIAESLLSVELMKKLLSKT